MLVRGKGGRGRWQAAYDALFLHLCVMGDYKMCVVSEEVLLENAIFVNSKLPKDFLPTELDLATREASAEATSKLIPAGVTRTELKLDTPLNATQHTMLVMKMIKTYESSIECLVSDEAKMKHRPSANDWVTSRIVIQMWDETLETCASKDLRKSDFEILRKIVLESSDLDSELLAARKRWPKWFHMGLLPNLVSDDKPSVDETMRNLSEAQGAAENKAPCTRSSSSSERIGR